MTDLSDLPDELQEGRAKPAPISDENRLERLQAIGQIIAKKRDDAVKARKESGIEDVWMACEEAYAGIDDANRSEFAKARWAKPMSMSGPVTTNNTPTPGNKSTAYVRLTTRYVDMGAAKLSEIVLPIDDKAFSFDNTPSPDLVHPTAAPATPAAAIMANPAAAAGAQPQPAPPVDPAEAEQKQAVSAAKKAETRVYDWMVESRYPMQMRKVNHDSARLGAGVLKGPFPDRREARAFTVKDGVGTLDIVQSISPACKWIDLWNLFPHGLCGEDIHSGDHILERDFLSAGGLRALKKMRGMPTADYPNGEPIYIDTQIDRVLAEGPDKCNTLESPNPNQPENKNRFTIWHYTGTLDRDDMILLGAPGAEDLPDDVVECHAIVTLVNDSPIRATFNPLEKTGHFPYRVFPWSRRAGHWAGVGVAEQVSLPQRMVNAGTRGWMNNAGMTAGTQIVMDQRAVAGADGNNDLTPNKLWYLTGEAVADDVRKMFMAIEFPDRADTLQAIIEYAFKLAEEASNIPLISQGQTGPQDPQTFGQAELQNTNANTLLRDKAYSLDDFVTEPLVNDFYEWLLLDPDIPVEEKGDFKINARGSIAMVEKAIQEQIWAQLLPLAAGNPALGQNPKKIMAELLKAKRINPAMTEYTPEELANLQNQPPPKAPVVQVAEIRASTDIHRQDMADKTKLQIAAGDTDRDTAYNNSLAQRDEIARQAAREKHEMDMQLETLKYANLRLISLDDAKKELAQTAMKLQTQRELSRDALAVDIHKHHTPAPVITPPTEPAGRAPAGQAFAA